MPRPLRDLRDSLLPDREREICFRFRQVRLEEDMKQGPFAVRLGIPLSRLKSYEMARAPIRYSLASRLCEKFDINQRWLAVGNLFSKRPCFPLDPILQKCIPSRELFSRAFDLVIDEVVGNLLLWDHSRDRDAGVLDVASLPIGASPSFIRNRWRESVEQGLAEANEGLPDIPYQRLLLEVGGLIAKHLDENRRFRDEYISGRKEQKIELEKLYGAFVFDRLAGSGGWAESQALGLPSRIRIEIERARKREEMAIDALEMENDLTESAGTRSPGVDENHNLQKMQKDSLSHRIISARETAALTQRQAADEWKISVGTLRDWEQGRSEPRGLYRERIEKVLAEIEDKSEK